MRVAAACPPSVVADTIMRTIEWGGTITDAAIDDESTTTFCTPVIRDPRCPGGRREGRYRDAVSGPLTDLPVTGYPLVLKGGSAPLPVPHHCVWASGVQPGPGHVGGAAIRYDPALCPVCVAAVAD